MADTPISSTVAVFDRDGQGVLQACASYLGFNRMGRRVDVDPGGNLDLIANCDAVAIEQNAVVVHERPVADGDVIAVVAPEGRFEHASLTNSAEQLHSAAQLQALDFAHHSLPRRAGEPQHRMEYNFPALSQMAMIAGMERIAHKSRSFREARAWEIAQYRKMTPAERIKTAHALRARIYPPPQPDVRECHRKP